MVLMSMPSAHAGLFDFLKPKPPPEPPPMVLNQPSPPAEPPQGSVLGLNSERVLPPLFRSSDDPTILKGAGVSAQGLSTLRASASGQFDREQLYLLQFILRDRDVHIIDLRAEPHGLVNRAAITWAPEEGKTPTSSPQTTELRWLKQAMDQRTVPVKFYAPGNFADPAAWQVIDLIFDVRTTATPARMIAEARFSYHRIAFQDGKLPTAAVIDQFIRTMTKLPASAWAHLHCDTGGYRASLCYTMWDMMKNSTVLPADQIVERQRRLGGMGLTRTPEVRQFLAEFFQYCEFAGPEFKTSWSSWSRRRLDPR